MAISPQRLTIYLYSVIYIYIYICQLILVIFAIAQLSCLLYVAVQVLEAIPLNCTSSVLRLFVMPTSSLIVLSTFGIHYQWHCLLMLCCCVQTKIAPFVLFISLIIVYGDHLHIFPCSLFSLCILCCFVSSLIVFRTSVIAGCPALKSCLTLIIVSSNKIWFHLIDLIWLIWF